MKKFRHLNVPNHWEHYWSKYPEGYTILEALLNWVHQVDDMVDNVNEWNEYLDEFVKTFDENLRDEVRDKLVEWEKDGTLGVIINEALSTRIDELSRDAAINLVFPPFGLPGITEGSDMSGVIQNIMNEYPGRRFILPKGVYTVENTVEVPAGSHLIGLGGTLITTEHIPILSLTNGVRIEGVKFEGTGFYNDNERAIEVIGGYTEWKRDITITECESVNMGGYFARLEFVEGAKITHNRILETGFAGVIAQCSKYINVDYNYIDGIENANSNRLAYGVAFNRSGSTDNLDISPRSSYCTASYNVIKNIEQWEALDTHAGEHIDFLHNHIENCYVGIALTQSHSGGVGDYGAQYCTVFGNYMKGTGDGVGIGVAGGQGVDPSYGIVVASNTIINHGRPDNTISGAIRLRDTVGVVVKDNLIYRAALIALAVYNANHQFVITGNTIIDPNSSNSTAVSGIAIRTGDNSGIVEKNNLLTEDVTINTHVSLRGIWLTQSTERVVIRDNVNDFQIPVMGYAEHVSLMEAHNGIKLYAGETLDPNGKYEGEAGSLFLSRSDQATYGSLLFLNTDGTADGWVSVSLHLQGFSEEIPPNPALGATYWNRTLRQPLWFNGANWTDADGTPVDIEGV